VLDTPLEWALPLLQKLWAQADAAEEPEGGAGDDAGGGDGGRVEAGGCGSGRGGCGDGDGVGVMQPKITPIPIVMTGTMTPLGFEGSDGLQNLTESLFAIRFLTPGIYIVIHGQHFPIGHVRKDKQRCRFVWSKSPGP
jgi:hypothetical protein